MKIVGCDLHARQQTKAMVDTETGEFTDDHEGNAVRAFYAALESPVSVGIEATGAMQWFLELLEELGIECRVGHPAKIRAQETRKQKHDRRDARLLLKLLSEGRFPEIWTPSCEQRDLRTLLRDRDQWVRMRTRLQHTLQAIALNHAMRQGRALWSARGRCALEALPLPPYTSQRRSELLGLCAQLLKRIQKLDQETGSRSGSADPPKATGAPAADTSGRGTGDGIGQRGVSRRPEPLCHRQPGSQLYRDDPMSTH
jgi:transposase